MANVNGSLVKLDVHLEQRPGVISVSGFLGRHSPGKGVSINKFFAVDPLLLTPYS